MMILVSTPHLDPLPQGEREKGSDFNDFSLSL
jgi:hypothetical protein